MFFNIDILTKSIQVQEIYRAKLNASLGKIVKTQKQLNAELKNFKKITTRNIEQNRAKITKNRADINSLARHTSVRMSPKEQLAALEEPIFAKTVTEQEKSAIKVQAKQQQLIENVQGFIDDANSIAVIANNIGLPHKVTKVFNKVHGVVTSIASAAASFTAGGPVGILAGIASIVSIVGVFQESPEEIMMKNQQQIMKGIQDILKGQGILANNQEKIMKGIKELFKAIPSPKA